MQKDLAHREYHASATEGSLEAPNRAQNLRTTFMPQGIEMVPRSGNAESPAWRWQWQTLAFGRQGALHEGRIEEAREALTAGEAILREVENSLELSKLLCFRGELEFGSENVAGAETALGEVEALANQSESGSDSELGHMLANLRHALSVNRARDRSRDRKVPRPGVRPRERGAG